MLDQLTREEVRDERLTEDEDGDCLYCRCRPSVMFCGRYEDGPSNDSAWVDSEICPECIDVLDSTGCPNCGCCESEYCRLCDSRPWWSRWLS